MLRIELLLFIQLQSQLLKDVILEGPEGGKVGILKSGFAYPNKIENNALWRQTFPSTVTTEVWLPTIKFQPSVPFISHPFAHNLTVYTVTILSPDTKRAKFHSGL